MRSVLNKFQCWVIRNSNFLLCNESFLCLAGFKWKKKNIPRTVPLKMCHSPHGQRAVLLFQVTSHRRRCGSRFAHSLSNHWLHGFVVLFSAFSGFLSPQHGADNSISCGYIYRTLSCNLVFRFFYLSDLAANQLDQSC